jgi:hypothetical protein
MRPASSPPGSTCHAPAGHNIQERAQGGPEKGEKKDDTPRIHAISSSSAATVYGIIYSILRQVSQEKNKQVPANIV